MINNNEKTSILVDSQLPEFIQADPDYANFRLFLQAYYEWMEQDGGAIQGSKNLLSYHDIDQTTDEFKQYFINDFLPYFPNNSLIDERFAVKIARQLYQSKGTPASYKFLFKVLFNSDFEVFYTKDAVLKASSGIWYVPKSLKLLSEDNNWLLTKNLRVLGETTKTIATIENAIMVSGRIEIFISNIERLFQSGEFVRVVDNNNQDVYFLNNKIVTSDTIGAETLRAKILGQISQVNVDPKNRGLLYQPGYPVIIHGGLSSNTGHGATAVVGETTSGTVQRINLVKGGYGYREDPNTVISFTNLNSGAKTPLAHVGDINPASNGVSVFTYMPTDTVAQYQNVVLNATNYNFNNIAVSNANTTMAKAFTFESFLGYPISSIIVDNGGGGISTIPTVTAKSIYDSQIYEGVDISSYGILGPIQIKNGGHNYQVGDTIVFTGGIGVGAAANVHTVNSTGAITSVQYIPYSGGTYPLGGMGYNNDYLPTLSVNSASILASNASLYVPGICGTGAEFSVVTDRTGTITTINVTDFGEDYIGKPEVSLRVMDVLVANVNPLFLPQKDYVVYQGDSGPQRATFYAYYESIELFAGNNDTTKSIYNMRVYDYKSIPDPTKPFRFDEYEDFVNQAEDESENYPVWTMLNYAYVDNTHQNPDGTSLYTPQGYRLFGDGNAKATASYLNGLTVGQGQYLNSQGQPSSFDVLQDENYNNYTYQITVEKEIEKYREVLLNLLHPTGTKVLGRYAVKSEGRFNSFDISYVSNGYSLSYATETTDTTAAMSSNFTNYASNTVTFSNLGVLSNLSSVLTTNTQIEIINDNGYGIKSKINSIDNANNTIRLQDSLWLTFGNVAVVSGQAGSNTINIVSLTGTYDIINNGNYSNTICYLKDIVYPGDLIKIANNSVLTVDYVDYNQNTIYTTTNLSSNSESYMTVNRTFLAGGDYNRVNQITVYNSI